MKRVSPLSESNVARYVDLQLQAIKPKKSSAVADEAGFPQRNMLSMIRTGATKLPFERVAGLAKALRVDQNHLFRLALEEYLPDVTALLEEAGQNATTMYERELLAVWRFSTGDQDPPIAPVEQELSAVGRTAQRWAGQGLNSPGAQNKKADLNPIIKSVIID